MNKVYCIETKSFILQDNIKEYKITGETQKLGSVRCAVLKRGNKTYLKPWDQICNLKKQGEANISAKLNNNKVRNLITTFYKNSFSEEDFKEKVKYFADEYDVSSDTILDVLNGNSWRHVTVGLIAQLNKGNVNVLNNIIQVSNKTKGKNKLTGKLAKFIVYENIVNKVKPDALSKKYLVSKRTINRVLTGEAWKEYTVPAIAEYNNWK